MKTCHALFPQMTSARTDDRWNSSFEMTPSLSHSKWPILDNLGWELCWISGFLPGQGLHPLKEFLQAKMKRQHIPRGIFWGEIFHILLPGFLTGASLKIWFFSTQLTNISTLKESSISTSLISLPLKTNPTSQEWGLSILCSTQWCLDALDFESSDIIHLCLRGMTLILLSSVLTSG